MQKVILSLIALLASASIAYSDTPRSAEVYEYGIYTSPPGVEVGASREGVPERELDDIELVQSTRIVVAQIGVQFGFRYRLKGFSPSTAVALTVVTKIPAPGIVAPGKSVPFTEDEYTFVTNPMRNQFRTWSLDKKSDLVPGIWVIEIWYGNKKLTEQKFEVILPPIA